MFDVLIYLVVAVGCRAGRASDRHWPSRNRRMRDRRGTGERRVGAVVRRLSELETDRARMAAILSGMVEGVLVVDGDGRLRLVNDAARRMLNLESNLLGRHYVEAVRQPGVVGQLGAALKGEQRPPIEVPLDAVSSGRRAANLPRTSDTRQRRRGWRRARAARHQRLAQGRSRAARFRRERVARAAHAADGSARLRRSVDGRARGRRHSDEDSSRSSIVTRDEWNAWSATCCGWRGWMRSRKPPTFTRSMSRRCFARRQPICPTGSSARSFTSTSRLTPLRPSSRRTRRRCTMR